jgi:hypothetical protein
VPLELAGTPISTTSRGITRPGYRAGNSRP